MIAIEQILGARAMLGWSQRELAQAAGLSPRNIFNIEAKLVVPRLETIHAIKAAFEKAGIDFGSGCTVTLRREVFDMEKREGEDVLEFLIHDMMSSYRQGVNELLLCNSDESRWVEATALATAETYNKTLREYSVTERCLIMRGDKITFGYPTTYRWIPPELFSEVCYAVYGTTLALIVWHPILRTAVIRNASIADSYRRHFEFLWEKAETPPFVNSQRHLINPDRPRVILYDGEPHSRYPDQKQEKEVQLEEKTAPRRMRVVRG